jgi:opacity protein-like surface antigen
MINNTANKLMIFSIMSFFILSPSLFAQTVTPEAKKEVKKIVLSTKRQIHKHAIGIGLGQTFLLGQFDSHGDSQITADILYSYTASYSFDLLLNAHFSEHAHDNKRVLLKGYTMSIKARSYEYDSFSPFLLGGLGFYMPQIEESDGEISDPKYTFGFNLGAGIDLRLNDKFVIGILSQYHKPFEVKQDTTKNVSGSYFKLLLTGMFLY